MAFTIQFLLGLLLVTQICCHQESVFILGKREKFTVHDTSVTFENITLKYPHVESLVRYEVKGAIGSAVRNLAFVLNTVNEINLDDENKPFLSNCELSLKSPKDELSKKVYGALKDLMYNTTCENSNGLKDLAFDAIVGNNNIDSETIKSSLDNARQTNQDISSKYDKHQQGVNTIADMVLDYIKMENPVTYIEISDIDSSDFTIKNLRVGDLTTLTRSEPFKIQRKNDSLKIDAAFKIRPRILATVRSNLLKREADFTTSGEKMVVEIKLNLNYSVEPCRIDVIDMNLTNEKFSSRWTEKGLVPEFINSWVPSLQMKLTPEKLLPPIRKAVQDLINSQNLGPLAESLRPVFLKPKMPTFDSQKGDISRFAAVLSEPDTFFSILQKLIYKILHPLE